RVSSSAPSNFTGRQRGVQNYGEEDLKVLFECILKHKPGGTTAWEAMANDYNQYAATKGRSYREPKALKEKY
ncbi:hypothetical protein BOTBODRAFT_84517, partial [Botryobasidium botryosum FD-172 SS1]